MALDPLLHSGTTNFMGSQTMNYDARIAELQQAQQVLQQQKMQAEAAAAGKPQQSSTATPIWDEIERITDELSESEFAFIGADEEYKKSQEAINTIILREQLRIVRPIAEQSADGKQALQTHLDNLKQLRKMAKKNAESQMVEWQDYMQNYADMPFADYKKMKLKKKGEK